MKIIGGGNSAQGGEITGFPPSVSNPALQYEKCHYVAGYLLDVKYLTVLSSVQCTGAKE